MPYHHVPCPDTHVNSDQRRNSDVLRLSRTHLVEQRPTRVPTLVRPRGRWECFDLRDIQCEWIIANDDGLAGGREAPRVKASARSRDGFRSLILEPATTAGGCLRPRVVVINRPISPRRIQVAVGAPRRVPGVRRACDMVAASVSGVSSALVLPA